MTKEEKELLIKDLSARLPYGVKVQYKGNRYDLTEMHKDGRTYLGSYNSIYGDWHCSLEFETYPTPYLRPMSSMTEEEIEIYRTIVKSLLENSVTDNIATLYNFLNSKHLDYNGLIHLGLAIEVTKENNPYKD